MILETFLSCAGACTIQGSVLFWIKPIMKNQHVYGGSFIQRFKVLSQDPDRFRFYRGFLPSVIKGSIGRTTDITLYNLLSKKYENTNYVPFICGFLSSIVKVSLMPLDTISNVYQVHGKDGKKYIKGNLYRGTLAYGAIHAISSSLWLLSYSHLKNHNHFSNENLNHIYTGLGCSIITDTIVNPIRVTKTNIQAFSKEYAYLDVIQSLKGSFYRGFQSRLLFNSLNSSLFVLFWKNLEEQFSLV